MVDYNGVAAVITAIGTVVTPFAVVFGAVLNIFVLRNVRIADTKLNVLHNLTNSTQEKLNKMTGDTNFDAGVLAGAEAIKSDPDSKLSQIKPSPPNVGQTAPDPTLPSTDIRK